VCVSYATLLGERACLWACAFACVCVSRVSIIAPWDSRPLGPQAQLTEALSVPLTALYGAKLAGASALPAAEHVVRACVRSRYNPLLPFVYCVCMCVCACVGFGCVFVCVVVRVSSLVWCMCVCLC
jgi:hypothetical protein